MDGLTVVYEELMALLGERVRIDSIRYPDDPAVGILRWVGYEGLAAGWSAWVERAPGITRYVPLSNIAFYALERAA